MDICLRIIGTHLLTYAEFREDWQYDSLCQVPDFFIPDSDMPKFFIEVHQTDARDSFRMEF